MRHGPAGDRERWRRAGRPDAERPLTPRGSKKAREAAAGLRRAFGRLDMIATSPWTRAAQTAALLAGACGGRIVETDALLPDRAPEDLLAWLSRRRERRVALVGHEPHLSRLASWLMTGAARSRLRLKKSQALLLELPRPEAGAGVLVWSLAPRHLRALSRRPQGAAGRQWRDL